MNVKNSRGVLRILLLVSVCLGALMARSLAADDAADRAALVQAIIAEPEQQAALIERLASSEAPIVRMVLVIWRQGEVLLHVEPDGTKVPLIRENGKLLRIDNGQAQESGDAKVLDTTAKLRKAIKGTLDLLTLTDPDPAARRSAVMKLGMEQKAAYLPILEARRGKERNRNVLHAIDEAQAIIRLADATPEVRAVAVKRLSELNSISSLDLLKKAVSQPKPVGPAAASAVRSIESYLQKVNFCGTIFRGLSTGSILLVVALGLAITFGLMGVINMAHGELMVVGAYTTYAVQNIFGTGLFMSLFGANLNIPGMNVGGIWYDFYFITALPAAFLTAALVGIALERGVIRYLYKRPLESLLATWGVSLVLQQLFRLTFGANNVQVYSPQWLSGNFTVYDVIFGWNRLFVIGFAILIVVGTWLLLTRTPLGLLIRCVMQNREMAACMGVRTEWVNMMTFGFGSGLAGLAGAFLSQIGNVGPGLGQSWIVDCFMTVVVGGVGNIIGTICSAMGIGVLDQTLQQMLLNPVLGKIIVLGGIILFLQWKPGGLFPTRSRSLEG
jgi:urea transport system permease protein